MVYRVLAYLLVLVCLWFVYGCRESDDVTIYEDSPVIWCFHEGHGVIRIEFNRDGWLYGDAIKKHYVGLYDSPKYVKLGKGEHFLTLETFNGDCLSCSVECE